MEKINYPLCCYCNGEIMIEGENVGYKDGEQVFVFVSSNQSIDCESIDTWGWFMGCIRRFVTRREGLCVISDRHIGIMRAMNDVHGGWAEPHAYHRYCIRHHASNINTKFKSNEVKLAFLSTASAKQLKRFKRGMAKIGEMNPSAKALLESIPASKWSLCHDGGHRYGIRTTNNSECFNGVLKRVRFLPITALVKATFFRLNSYFVERRGHANDMMLLGHTWSEKVQVNLQKNIDLAAHHTVTIFDHQTGLYGVVTGRGNRLATDSQHSHTVLLSEKTCTCNKWQIYHYPCSHVMAVCRSFGISSDQYVDPLYSCGELYGSYRSSFHPVPDEANWTPWDGPKNVWQIAGPLLLLQLWSWERISIARPIIKRSKVPMEEGVDYPLGSQMRVGIDPLGCKWLRVARQYKDHRLGLSVLRDLFDRMVELQFVWVPYTSSVLQHLSPRCSENQEEWYVIAPLICFEMVEWHLPNRCMRQFGWDQSIPELCNTSVELHNVSRQGNCTMDFAQLHRTYIRQWDNRMQKTVQGRVQYSGLMSRDNEYYEWYTPITRQRIAPHSSQVYDDYDNHHYYYPTAADYQTLTESNVYNYNTMTTMLENMSDDVPLSYCALIEKMRTMSLNALRTTNQGHLVHYEEPRPPSPPRYNFRHLEHRLQFPPSQESEGGTSSSRARKKGKSRQE